MREIGIFSFSKIQLAPQTERLGTLGETFGQGVPLRCLQPQKMFVEDFDGFAIKIRFFMSKSTFF